MQAGNAHHRREGVVGARARSWVLYSMIACTLLPALACGGEDEAAADSEFDVQAAPATTAAAAATIAMSSEEAGMAVEADVDLKTQSTSGDESGPAGPEEAGPQVATLADLGRDIIYRGTVSVQASDVDAAVQEAVSIVQTSGGIVFGQQVRSSPEPLSYLTFKVEPPRFMQVLERLAAVGELIDKQITADDVTGRIVDFRSRIATAEASVLRLRDLLESAPDLENVALIERELLQRETDLETLRGRLRTLTDQVSLATIDMTILQLPEPVPETGIRVDAWVSDSDEDPCLGDDRLGTSADADAYFCIQVENTGEVALTDIEVSSEALRLRPQDGRADPRWLRLADANFDRIGPGELLSAVLRETIRDGRMAGRVVTRGGIDVGFEVSGTPVAADGASLEEVVGLAYVQVEVAEDAGAPSFADALGSGYQALVLAVGYIIAIVGLLLPFVPVAIVIGVIYWFIKRWRRIRRSGTSSTGDSNRAEAEHATTPSRD